MTVREIRNAITGFQKLQTDRFAEFMTGVRIVSFWATKNTTKKVKKPEDLFALDFDREAKRQRRKTFIPIEVIPRDVYDKQFNR